jgi:hypothetical protein
MANYGYVDEDLMNGEVEWMKSSGSRKVCWSIPSGRKIRVRFVTDPATLSADFGWCFYREVNAFNGLIGGAEMPNGLKEFPVDDLELLTDPETGRRMQTRKPDILLKRVRPSKWDMEDGRNYASARDRVVGNAVYESGDLEKNTQYNPAPGQLILLKMSKTGYGDLRKAFAIYKNADPNFTPIGAVWDLVIEGKGATARLIVTRANGEPPVDMPDPIDTVAWVNDLRASAEKFVFGLDSAAQEEGTTSFYGDDDEIVDQFEANVTAQGVGVIDWTSIAPTALKRKLVAVGVNVPQRIRNDELIELGKLHLTAEDL